MDNFYRVDQDIEERNKEERRTEELRVSQKQQDMRDILRTPAGIRFFRDMFNSCSFCVVDCFNVTENTSDTLNTICFNAGKRAFMVTMFNLIREVAPEKLPLIFSEGT